MVPDQSSWLHITFSNFRNSHWMLGQNSSAPQDSGANLTLKLLSLLSKRSWLAVWGKSKFQEPVNCERRHWAAIPVTSCDAEWSFSTLKNVPQIYDGKGQTKFLSSVEHSLGYLQYCDGGRHRKNLVGGGQGRRINSFISLLRATISSRAGVGKNTVKYHSGTAPEPCSHGKGQSNSRE